MRDIIQNDNVPCFYHVPKNAGTFVISSILLHFRLFRASKTNWLALNKETARNIVIWDNNKEVARVIAGDPNFICNDSLIFKKGNDEDNTHYTIQLNQCSPYVFESLNIFSIVIEADGFKLHSEITTHFRKYNLISFMILRNSLDRAISFFNYINSESAKHEPTYGIIPSSFEDYVKSEYIEDSWLIRQFSEVGEHGIQFNNLQETYDVVKNFEICDIEKTDEFICYIFRKYVDLNLTKQQKSVSGWNLEYNSNLNKKNSYSESLISILEERMKYDIELYQKLVKC